MFSIYDEQLNHYLHVGRNSETLDEAIENCWDYWIGGADLYEEDRLVVVNWDLKRKLNWLGEIGFRFDEHKEKIVDDGE